MKVVEQFKRRILALAIRGKLVPQDPNDEPANILLERIKAEKAKLVKAGKIKKEKSPSEIVIGSDGAAYEKRQSAPQVRLQVRRLGLWHEFSADGKVKNLLVEAFRCILKPFSRRAQQVGKRK